MINSGTLYSIFIHTLIGDALGTPLDGLSKGHIHATFRNIEGYTDALPALRGKADQWKKPALYSSISQMLILFSLIRPKGRFSLEQYREAVSATPESADSKFRIFRHPDSVTENFILRCCSPEKAQPTWRQSAHIAPMMLHLCLDSRNRKETLLRTCTLSKHFSEDLFSIAGSVFYTGIFLDCCGEIQSGSELPEAAIESCRNSMGLMESESADIFNAGINPDSLLQSARAFIRSIEATASGGDRDTIEKKLVDNLNSTLKTPVTRPTVNHPMVIIPRSLHMASHYASAPAEGLFSAVGEGGAAAASGACSGSFMGLLNEAGSIPPNLTEELINRKRITGIIESVVNRRSPRDLCEDFIRSEAALTAKERDEWKARTKNIKTPAADRKKEQSAHDREARLAKHVVESWTKYDKAKWKKERRRAKEG